MVRALIEKKTDLGLQMQPYIMAGELVPDELIFPLAMQRIVHSEETKRGQTFLLDGFPRNLEQAKQFEKLFMEAVPGGKIDLVLNLQLREDILVKKIVHRWNCPQCNAGYNFASIIEPENGINLPPLLPKHDKMCDNCPTVHLTQREDDTVAIVQSRLKAYHALTQPLLAHYRYVHPSRFSLISSMLWGVVVSFHVACFFSFLSFVLGPREKHAKSPLTAAPVIDIDVSKGKGSVSPLLVQVVQSVFMR